MVLVEVYVCTRDEASQHPICGISTHHKSNPEISEICFDIRMMFVQYFTIFNDLCVMSHISHIFHIISPTLGVERKELFTGGPARRFVRRFRWKFQFWQGGFAFDLPNFVEHVGKVGHDMVGAHS